ncbi:MAG TPA: hypothetical protein VLM79_24220, partial [Kofleriaceae bacterium]|nr:hypothetical protein [Kofleriaceae bacterium]
PGGAPSRTPGVTPAPEFALGAPGAASRRPVEPVEDVALGAPGRAPARPTPASQPAAAPSAPSDAGDMSLDLADHIPVGRADVQEAVRASRVMSAVEVPQSVLDAIEDRPTSPAASPGFDSPPHGVRVPEPRRDLPVPPPPRELREQRIEVKQPERVGKSPPAARAPSGPLKPPVELPRQPLPPEPAPVPEPPSGSKTSRVLVGLLILAAVAVGAYLASRFLFGKTETSETSAEQTPAQPVTPPPAPPAPPPPPPPVTAKIAMETPPVDEVKADHAGVIETILADKSTVKAGDVIAKLVGDKPIEAELASIGRDVKRLTDQIDAANQKLSAAQSAGNKNGETAVTAQLETLKKSLGTKHDLQATKTTDLDKFLMHAPSAGTFTPAVKLGKKIAANDVVATIQRDPKPVATFKVPDAKPFTANGSVDLGFATNDQHVTCVVAEVQEGSIKVACPSDPALVEGADVTLKTTMAQPTPSEPPAPAAPPATPGSAAPGAGSDGSGAGTAPMPTTAPTAPAPPSPSAAP